MFSATGTEPRIHYVIVHDDISIKNLWRATGALADELTEAGVPQSFDDGVELWSRSDGFMVCVPVYGADTRHLKFEGWSRVK